MMIPSGFASSKAWTGPLAEDPPLTETVNEGGQMYKRVLACCLVVMLSVGVLQAQLYFGTPPFSLRAASVEPVDGWQTMRVEHCQGERCTIWVSGILALTESDIEQAQPQVRADGYTVINIVLTDTGAKKLHDLIGRTAKETK